ncbi:MAG TPA: hypothetical protein DHM37_09335 [Candidatus Cloacimonas sp.]|nr:hypothetical protein [Candidatus Cloacimonas sp.]
MRMSRYILLILALLLLAQLAAQTIIGEGLVEEELLNYVVENYKTSSTLGYTNCRDVLYSEIDLQDGNILEGIYSGYAIEMDLEQDPSNYAYQNDINCEHSWPQSMGAGSEPQKSDMHHLYPSRAQVNSSRGNSPFAEVEDSQTNKWWKNDFYLIAIPQEDIEDYSESGNDQFEPREIVKGNIARSMFYFFAMYQDAANENFWQIQKDVLYDWHYADPVDSKEQDRTWAIAAYQDDCPNPFVVDSTLARRIWFYTPTSNDEQVVTAQLSLQNYPNPFNPQTTIIFNIPQQQEGILSIYNVRGQQILSKQFSAGKHQFSWNGQQLASGVYFYKLETSSAVLCKKMLLLK